MKLYNYSGGTAYNVFDIDGGGTLIEMQDEFGVSHICCSRADAEDTVNELLEGKEGTVCFHAGLFTIESIRMVDECEFLGHSCALA